MPASQVALASDDRHVRYGELQALLLREIAWLTAAGVRRVAILADNGVPWAVADLALHLGGVLAVPLPSSFTTLQVQHSLDDAGVDAVFVDDESRTREGLAGWYEHGAAPASGLTLLRRSIGFLNLPPVPPGCAKITYTSGSTAQPKGVCLSQSQLETVATALAMATCDLDIEKHLCVLPLATLLENVAGVYAPLLAGATCLLPGSDTTGMSYARLDPGKLLAAIARYAPNSLILVPELLQVLVAASERGWSPPASLRFIAVGGAAVSRGLSERADSAGLPVYEGYGLSECASVVCLNTPRSRRAGTVGRPLSHVQLRVDDEGQVRVSGSTMLGYLGEPPRAAASEIATGDLGEFDDGGFLRLHGRAGNVFITSYGRNVSPEWIESELSQLLAGHPVLAWARQSRTWSH